MGITIPQHWTKERCRQEAAKFPTRSAFKRGRQIAYVAARLRGWLDDICGHMHYVGHLNSRVVYEIADPERRIVYVGLTCNLERRMRDHMRVGHLDVRALLAGPHTLTVSEPLSADEAADREARTIKRRQEAGWTILNRVKGGSLGGKPVWARETVLAEAKRYARRKDFKRGSVGAYEFANAHGILDEACAHMQLIKRRNGYWTKARTAVEAAKYRSRASFQTGHPTAYKAAFRGGWLDEVCAHMRPLRTRWTRERVLAEASKHRSTYAFEKAAGGAYNAARREGWMAEVRARFSHD